jgi:hypothetical protein
MDSAKPLKELVIDQEKTGYRYSIEPFLLAYFMSLLPGQSVRWNIGSRFFPGQ